MDAVKHYETLQTSLEMTLDQIKAQYHKLALIYHPDRPTGDAVTMQRLNTSWEWIRANHGSYTAEERAHIKWEIRPDILDKAVKIKNLDARLDVIIAGAWIWIEGGDWLRAEEQLRAALKGEGFRFSREKLAWYFAGCKSYSRKSMSMDRIYDAYGRHDVAAKHRKELAS